MKKHYDKHRLEGPRLERGDKVYLISRHLRTNRPSQKLDFKKLGPFKVEECISESNYRLSLPATMKLRTNVFHISLLEPAPKNARLANNVEAEDKEEEWDVEEILDSRIKNGQLQYLIKWLGFGPEDNSWEPIKHLHCPEKLQEFYQRYPDALKTTDQKPRQNRPARKTPKGPQDIRHPKGRRNRKTNEKE